MINGVILTRFVCNKNMNMIHSGSKASEICPSGTDIVGIVNDIIKKLSRYC
jgi:hypothetical protein